MAQLLRNFMRLNNGRVRSFRDHSSGGRYELGQKSVGEPPISLNPGRCQGKSAARHRSSDVISRLNKGRVPGAAATKECFSRPSCKRTPSTAREDVVAQEVAQSLRFLG